MQSFNIHVIFSCVMPSLFIKILSDFNKRFSLFYLRLFAKTKPFIWGAFYDWYRTKLIDYTFCDWQILQELVHLANSLFLFYSFIDTGITFFVLIVKQLQLPPVWFYFCELSILLGYDDEGCLGCTRLNSI